MTTPYKKRRLGALSATFCIWAIFFGCIGCQDKGVQVVEREASAGILRLLDWDPKAEEMIQLVGEWSYVPYELIDSFPTSSENQYIYLPDTWGESTIKQSFEEGQGCASLRLVLEGLPQIKLALAIKQINSAYQLLLNGELVHQNGQVTCDPSDATPDYTYQPYVFDNRGDQLEIILQISN